MPSMASATGWCGPTSAEQFCAACRHNRTIPDLSQPDNLAHWRKIELAKHRLFYTLLKLRLPLATKAEDPAGLAFDFIADRHTPHGHIPVMTGHDNGLITINLAEADDSERERMRRQMGEPYRTLLGHFRHEIAHYYWDRLVANSPKLAEFRETFGDERQDYTGALQQHYANGPPPDWPERFVTAYASSHPWEDFAETWAHYFHMVDTLETASAFGLSVRPKLSQGSELATKIDFDPARRRHGSHHRRLAAAHLRGQLDQPQHGPAGPLSVRPGAARDREAVVHPRADPCRAPAASAGHREVDPPRHRERIAPQGGVARYCLERVPGSTRRPGNCIIARQVLGRFGASRLPASLWAALRAVRAGLQFNVGSRQSPPRHALPVRPAGRPRAAGGPAAAGAALAARGSRAIRSRSRRPSIS